jgi:hypothetical protein
MTKRYCLLVAGLIMSLSSGTALAVPPPNRNERNAGQINGYESKSSERVESRTYSFALPFGVCTSFPATIDSLTKPNNPDDDNYYKPQDLRAQQATACFTEWIFYSAILQFLLSCVGAILLFRTIALGREANNIARETFVSQSRAWIKVNQYKALRLFRDGNQLGVEAEWEIKNVGHSPAHQVYISPVVSIGTRFLREGPFYTRLTDVLGPTVFASDTYGGRIISYGLLDGAIERERVRIHEECEHGWITKDEMNRKLDLIGKDGFRTEIYIIFYIFYGVSGSKILHKTVETYELSRDIPKSVIAFNGAYYSSFVIKDDGVETPGLGTHKFGSNTKAD